MKYPRFVAALRTLAPSTRAIADCIDRSERQATYYMTGNAMPSADILARLPDLYIALRRDLGLQDIYMATPTPPSPTPGA